MPVLAANTVSNPAASLAAVTSAGPGADLGAGLDAGGIEDSAFAALLDGLLPGLTGDGTEAPTDPSALLPATVAADATAPVADSASATEALPAAPLTLTLDFSTAIEAALAGAKDDSAANSDDTAMPEDAAAPQAKPAASSDTAPADPASLLASLILPTPPQNPLPAATAKVPAAVGAPDAAPDSTVPQASDAGLRQAAVSVALPMTDAPAAPDAPIEDAAVMPAPAGNAKPGQTGSDAAKDSKDPSAAPSDKDPTSDPAAAPVDVTQVVAASVPMPVTPPPQNPAAQTAQASAATQSTTPVGAAAPSAKSAANTPSKPQAFTPDDDSDPAAPTDKKAGPAALPQQAAADKPGAAKADPHGLAAPASDAAAPQLAQNSGADQPAPQQAQPQPAQPQSPAPAALTGLGSNHAAQPNQPPPPASTAASANLSAHVHVAPESATPNIPALAVSIAARSQSGARQFDIRLDPPELGRVDVRLSIDATGKAVAHMTADQPQTLDLLQKDSASLTRALRDAGLDVSQSGLNFSLKGQDRQSGDGHSAPMPRARREMLTATKSIDAVQTASSYRASAGDARLDISV